jgi:hypothetical protein
MLYFSRRRAWDRGRTTALLDIATDSLAVVSPAAEHLIGIAVDLLHQGREGGDVVCLPGRDYDPDRQPRGVDFGREAAARTTERVALGPPFPPAAQ